MKRELICTIDKKGWMVPYLIGLDQMFCEYWVQGIKEDEIPSNSIPQLEFCFSILYREQIEFNNIKNSLNRSNNFDTGVFKQIFDWLLWGFDLGKCIPDIDQLTDDFWYRTITFEIFFQEPTNHMWGPVRKLNLC